MHTLVDLSEAYETSVYGGKASALAQLLSYGFNVPDGFVISGDTEEAFTDEFIELIHKKYIELNSKYVAVRSSSVAEDGQNTSWAGQLETYLNVTAQQLVQKVKLCQSSAHSARAEAYAEQNKTDAGNTAVLIQKMVQPDISGVAFSVHPITQDSSIIVVEAVLGLGEALVSGAVTPDTYLLSKNSEKNREVHIGNQKKKLSQNESGQTLWSELILSEQPNLSADETEELAAIIVKLEQACGFAVDVEWAKVNGIFYILQCRPITTLG